MKAINHLKRATTEENITEVSPKIQRGNTVVIYNQQHI